MNGFGDKAKGNGAKWSGRGYIKSLTHYVLTQDE